MRRDRFFRNWSAGGLATGVLAASSAWGQAPLPPSGPAPCVTCRTEGPVKRATHRTLQEIQANFVGYPDLFVEPPPGYYNAEIFGLMRAKADHHRFTLYHSDFLDNSDRLSPAGAGRFNVMAQRMRGWLGPVMIEWSPDQPGLAEARRASVVGLLQGTGLPVIPERVVVAPSPYPGAFGQDAANNSNVFFSRNQTAPTSYSYTPQSGAGFGGAGGGAP